ncbi:MAG: M1 family aminopeptidase [Woeseia sp.]
MRRSKFVILLGLLACPAFAAPIPGHRLPVGMEQAVRERQVDIKRLTADLAIDMKRQTVNGSITVMFTPLRAGLDTLILDAADIDIDEVEYIGLESASGLDFSIGDRIVQIAMPAQIHPGADVAVRISYRARPDTGLYFFAESRSRTAEAWNYGEGGRHYNWLPLYNDTNDRFAVDFRVTVDAPYVVLGNGLLRETTINRGGSRTFHWLQEEPIPNYLLALNVGEFVEVPLADAEVGQRRIPLSVWTHAGDEESAAHSFKTTPGMVEYFSELLGYDYAWPKYDQVTLRNFSGAMETTTMVGFAEASLHREGEMADDGPALDKPFPTWTTEDTIAHELAHHWFGDLVTCRSLGSLWLNESFATYMHTVWNGHAQGEDDLTYQRWRYLQRYLAYIKSTGEVRPLEYFNYDSSDDMYTSAITYLKGSLVLHLLRHVLGGRDFYRGIKSYLHTHAFSEVDSFDFQRSMEKVSGGNLKWFFEDWIRGGGGYPALAVSHLWVPERSELDLTIEQVQAVQPFEDYFDVPIDVEIVTASASRVHTVRLNESELTVALPADSEPLMVVVDKGNWLIADIHQEQSADQAIYQLEHGDLAAALRAARQLAEDYPRDPAAVVALAGVLRDGDAYWGLRQEAAIDLGSAGGAAAVAALLAAIDDPDNRIRRAAAIGLGRAGGEESAKALEKAVTSDSAAEVIGAALIALGKMRAANAKDVLMTQIDRESRYYDAIRHSAITGLAELEDPTLAPVFARYVDSTFNPDVREAAIEGWVRAAPQDPSLQRALRELANDPDPEIRATALESMGELHHADDLEFLGDYAATAVDPNLQKKARDAAETIAAFVLAE